MDNYNIITPSSKFKHLSFQHYEYIIREITKHDAFHHGKKRNTGRTALIRSLASDVGTSVSNVYSIIKDASISILDSDLITHKELSASADMLILNVSPAAKKKGRLYTSADLTILVIVQAMKTAMDLFVDSSKKVLISTPSI